ncbi:DUF7003 family protein [Streptomyces zhihengii]
MTTSSILGQFDLCADKAELPDLDNGYYYPVDARMRLFGDNTRWAVVVELLVTPARSGNLIDVMQWFGNCLTRGDPGFGDFLARVDNMEEIDPDGAEVYAGGAPVVVRGTALPVDTHAGTLCRTCSASWRRRAGSSCWPTRLSCGPAFLRSARAVEARRVEPTGRLLGRHAQRA